MINQYIFIILFFLLNLCFGAQAPLEQFCAQVNDDGLGETSHDLVACFYKQPSFCYGLDCRLRSNNYIYDFNRICTCKYRSGVYNNNNNESDDEYISFFHIEPLERLFFNVNYDQSQCVWGEDEKAQKILDRLEQGGYNVKQLKENYLKSSIIFSEIRKNYEPWSEIHYFSSALLYYRQRLNNLNESMDIIPDNKEVANIYKKYCEDINQAYVHYDFIALEKLIKDRYEAELNNPAFKLPNSTRIILHAIFFVIIPILHTFIFGVSSNLINSPRSTEETLLCIIPFHSMSLIATIGLYKTTQARQKLFKELAACKKK